MLNWWKYGDQMMCYISMNLCWVNISCTSRCCSVPNGSEIIICVCVDHTCCCVHALTHISTFDCVLQSEYIMHKGKAALHISYPAQYSGVLSAPDCWKEANNGGKKQMSSLFWKGITFLIYHKMSLSTRRDFLRRFSASLALRSVFCQAHQFLRMSNALIF